MRIFAVSGADGSDSFEPRGQARQLSNSVGVDEAIQDRFPASLVLALHRDQGKQTQQAQSSTRLSPILLTR